MVSVKLALG